MTEHKSPLTEAQIEECSKKGFALALAIMPAMQGQPGPVLFNTLGSLTEAVFLGLPFNAPHEALEEFDGWVAYTRERIEAELKRRLS